MVAVSVIICTANPRMDIFQRVLDSVDQQTLAHSRYEVIVVDNNSQPPLSAESLRKDREMTLRVIREPRQGLSFARCAGINAASGKLFVFVDDDNFLDNRYLEAALKIAEENPEIGAYGGISEGVLERPIGKWKTKLLPYLGVRDYGKEPITSKNDHWGQWEPIGAGMVTRRDVAETFRDLVESVPHAGNLGRRGSDLLSGEDSLFARIANRLGYACSYQPSLKLQHFIKKGRLKLWYLAKLIKGHGRSYVVLQRVLGRPAESFGVAMLIARLGYRLKTAGTIGAMMWFWDLGYMTEARQPHKEKAPELFVPSTPQQPVSVPRAVVAAAAVPQGK